jgi:hypothetical protein
MWRPNLSLSAFEFPLLCSLKKHICTTVSHSTISLATIFIALHWTTYELLLHLRQLLPHANVHAHFNSTILQFSNISRSLFIILSITSYIWSLLGRSEYWFMIMNAAPGSAPANVYKIPAIYLSPLVAIFLYWSSWRVENHLRHSGQSKGIWHQEQC